jgi:hypothetical protein
MADAPVRDGEAVDATHDPGTPSTPGAVAALVVGVAAALVTLMLGAIKIGRSFNYDEAITYQYFINGGSLRRALTTQVVFNNHPTFSALQTIGWRLGLVGETTQRLGPIVCGGVVVGVTAWYTARRVGVVGGLAAGAVLVLNPLFLEQFRSLRGYALSTMAVVLAGLALERSWHDHRVRWLVVQGALMVVAVTTHAYSAVTLLMLAVATLSLGRLRRAHIAAWLASAVVALLFQLPLLDDARSNTRARGNLFYDEFPVRLTRSLLGWSWWPVAVVGAMALLGAWSLARRSPAHLRAVIASGSVLAVVVVVLWSVVQPRDLYARFFVSTIPLFAHLAGRGVARLPSLAGAAITVLIVALLIPGARDVVEAEPSLREVAAVVDRARDVGLEVCGWQAEALQVYTAPIRPVAVLDDPSGFAECDVYVAVLRLDPERRAIATDHFGAMTTRGGIRVWAEQAVLDEIARSP